jgi:hypothetical protein
MDASEIVRCVKLCQAMSTFGCAAIGNYCYTLRNQNTIKVCKLLCMDNCPLKFC